MRTAPRPAGAPSLAPAVRSRLPGTEVLLWTPAGSGRSRHLLCARARGRRGCRGGQVSAVGRSRGARGTRARRTRVERRPRPARPARCGCAQPGLSRARRRPAERAPGAPGQPAHRRPPPLAPARPASPWADCGGDAGVSALFPVGPHRRVTWPSIACLGGLEGSHLEPLGFPGLRAGERGGGRLARGEWGRLRYFVAPLVCSEPLLGTLSVFGGLSRLWP